MSYTNQTTTNLADLISKLNTFLSGTPGYTTHHNPAGGEFAARKTAAGVDTTFASQWDIATPSSLGIYQWFNAAYNSGVSPWQQTGDSGNGAASTSNATLALGRCATITNTPEQFWCFEDDNYFHCVVQVTSTNFIHFGAGALDKFNDWTGGEYAYGFRKDQSFSSGQSISSTGNSFLLDGGTADTTGLTNAEEICATVHAEGLAGQGVNEKWLVSLGNQSSALLGNDRQGSPQPRRHLIGGARAGLINRSFGLIRGTLGRGLCPMYPVIPFYWRRSPDELYGPMGQMKDVRMVNNRDFAAGDEITVGSDTWVIFPAGVKSTGDTMTGTGVSGFCGIAYKKVTT